MTFLVSAHHMYYVRGRALLAISTSTSILKDQELLDGGSESATRRPPVAISRRSTGVDSVDNLRYTLYAICYLCIHVLKLRCRLRQSIRIHLKNNRDKFHPDPELQYTPPTPTRRSCRVSCIGVLTCCAACIEFGIRHSPFCAPRVGSLLSCISPLCGI